MDKVRVTADSDGTRSVVFAREGWGMEGCTKGTMGEAGCGI